MARRLQIRLYEQGRQSDLYWPVTVEERKCVLSAQATRNDSLVVDGGH